MLRKRATWRRKMNNILKQKEISLEKILKINELVYDAEAKELVQWLLSAENTNSSEDEILKQIQLIHNTKI